MTEAVVLIEAVGVGVALVGAEKDVVGTALATAGQGSRHQRAAEAPPAPLGDDVELGYVSLGALRPDARVEADDEDPVGAVAGK